MEVRLAAAKHADRLLADVRDRKVWVEPGHWVLLPKFAGNGFRKNLTALPQRAGRGSVRGWRDKKCLPWLSPLARHPMPAAALCNVATAWYSVQIA
jgi:hypothetical protein